MVYRRSNRYPVRAWRKKRWNRRNKKRRIAKAIVRKTGITGKAGCHLVKQKVYSTFTIPASGVTPLPFYVNRTFTLADLPQASSFRQLYDQYCIFATSTKYILNSNTDPTTNQNMQVAYTTIDNDGSPNPPDWPAFMERASVKVKNLSPHSPNGCSVSIYQKPKPLTHLYESVSTTGYAVNTKKVWVDMSDPAVPHYGLLAGFNNGQETLNAEVKVTAITTYYMGFKGLL